MSQKLTETESAKICFDTHYRQSLADALACFGTDEAKKAFIEAIEDWTGDEFSKIPSVASEIAAFREENEIDGPPKFSVLLEFPTREEQERAIEQCRRDYPQAIGFATPDDA